MGLDVVPEVIERDVCSAGQAPTAPDDVDLQFLDQRGQKQRAVVGDAGAVRRQRRDVRDLHAASNRSMTFSQVARAAISWPERPHSRVWSG